MPDFLKPTPCITSCPGIVYSKLSGNNNNAALNRWNSFRTYFLLARWRQLIHWIGVSERFGERVEGRPWYFYDKYVTFIERFVHSFIWAYVSWTHVLISNSWQAWLGIVDQNWLKLALAKLTFGQPISLKVVGMATPVKTTVRSKFPFICM